MAPPISNGQPDSFFITEVRRRMKDLPTWYQESLASDGTRGAYLNSASPIMHVTRSPVQRSIANQSSIDSYIRLTGLAGANQTGFSAYTPLFDPAQPIGNITTDPVISDGGAGGTLAAATYQVVYTYVLTGGALEVGMSPISGNLTIALNHRITVAALSNIPTGVGSVNYYLATSTAGGSSVGFVGNQVVASGAVPAFTFSAGGNGTVPVLIVAETGELFFPVAPATGQVTVQYQTFRFSDQQVTDALYEGLDLLWPDIWNYQAYDLTSVLPSPIQWEYALPTTYADLRAVITEVETRPPSAFIIFKRISGWRFLDDPVTPTLIFEKPPPVGGQVRIRYVIPFSTLAQVPTIAQFLPVYYAIASLLSDQETFRARADDLPALTSENAAPPGTATQTAAWWIQSMFQPNLKRLSLGFPARRSVMNRVVERLGLGPIWQRPD